MPHGRCVVHASRHCLPASTATQRVTAHGHAAFGRRAVLLNQSDCTRTHCRHRCHSAAGAMPCEGEATLQQAWLLTSEATRREPPNQTYRVTSVCAKDERPVNRCHEQGSSHGCKNLRHGLFLCEAFDGELIQMPPRSGQMSKGDIQNGPPPTRHRRSIAKFYLFAMCKRERQQLSAGRDARMRGSAAGGCTGRSGAHGAFGISRTLSWRAVKQIYYEWSRRGATA